MHILLWVVQAALAFLYLSGGSFKFFSYHALTKLIDAVPPAAWQAIGVLEMVGAVLLIVPAAMKRKPILTPIAAAALAVEALCLCVLFAQYSLEIAATNPLVWNVVMGLMAAFVAYGRFKLRPV